MANNIIKPRNKDGSDSQEYKQLKKDTESCFVMSNQMRLNRLLAAKNRTALEAIEKLKENTWLK